MPNSTKSFKMQQRERAKNSE